MVTHLAATQGQNPAALPIVILSIFRVPWRILWQGQKGMFEKLKIVASSLKRELRVYQMVMKDSRTPKLSKILLGLAVGYVLLPFDIIPDFIPVIGHVDDLVIVPALAMLALRNVPQAVLDDCRMRAVSQEGPFPVRLKKNSF